MLKLKEREEAHKQMTHTRMIEEAIRRANLPLGDPTKAVRPEDMKMMFLGFLAQTAIKGSTANKNRLKGLKKAYGSIYTEVEADIKGYLKEFELSFARVKRTIETEGMKHPLAQALCSPKIRGFTVYQLVILMSEMRNVYRFETPSDLAVWAGVAPKHGMQVSLKNMNVIRDMDFKTKNKHFKGYNTRLQGRMYVMAECLVKAQGFFTNEYQQQRVRIEQKAINEKRVFIATAEDVEKSKEKDGKAKMKAGEYYMTGRKNQSLKAWSDSNAKWRVARLMLQQVYQKWCELCGITPRAPYAFEYLGHTNLITLEDIIAFDSKVVVSRKKKEE